MDYIVFILGAACFGAGFFLLLIFLYLKKKLVLPFVFMTLGVVLCFIGLMIADPLTHEASRPYLNGLGERQEKKNG